MAKKGRIKKPKTNQGPLVKALDTPDYDKLPPVFSLERIQAGPYCFSALSTDDKAHFSEAIYRRKDLKWSEITGSQRHGLGTEKLAKTTIKRAAVPAFITEDESNLMAFRYGQKKAMVGYRRKNIFFVLWFDHDFTLYDHG